MHQMQVFMIEWWNEYSRQYQQEYYRHMKVAALRFQQIQDNCPDSNPEISTVNIYMDTEYLF